jgi:hypothetical protein
MEYWSNGMLEYWSTGVVEYWRNASTYPGVTYPLKIKRQNTLIPPRRDSL